MELPLVLASGRLLAWVVAQGDDEFVAAFVGEDAAQRHGNNAGRAPAMQLCSSSEEARQWVHAQAGAVGRPIRWLNAPPQV